jgi:hypothetical protein
LELLGESTDIAAAASSCKGGDGSIATGVAIKLLNPLPSRGFLSLDTLCLLAVKVMR